MDALGRRTESVYDSRNRLMASVRKDTLGNLLTQSGSLYDVTNHATGAIDANGNRTNTVFDKRGRRIREIDALGNITRFTYDATNQLVAQVDAKGNLTRFVYDDLGRQIKVIDANGNATQTVYDQNGNVIARIDANGNRTESRYDNRDRLVRTYDANNTSGTEASRKFTETKYGKVTSNGKDYAQTQIIDPTLNATTYVYDGLGRLSTDTNQLGKTRTYKYDAVGNQIESIDRNGLDRTFEYDTLNRQTKENWVEAGAITRSFTSQYDVLDRLVDVTDNSIAGGITTKLSQYSYLYDDLDRVRAIDNLGVGSVAPVQLSYGYDAEGNLKSVTDTINGVTAGTTAYNYDALNRTTQITQSGAGITNKQVKLSYNAVGQMETLQRLTGTTFNQTATTTYAYNDPLNRLTQIQHSNATGGILSSYAFNYDNGSRIRKIQNADGTFVNYDYANSNELKQADYSPVARTDENYTYDANGNRTNTGYVTGANNQLSSDGTYTYTYDDEGNLKTRTETATSIVRSFTWDSRNRLIRVTDSAGLAVSYAYDANNQRLAKTTSGVTTRYVYDRGNVALEFSGTGATPMVRYFYGTQVDQILAQDKGSGNVSWVLTDQLGSVRALVGNDGVVRNRYDYAAFGTVSSTMTGATDTARYQYTGRELDGETGLYYYRARYYDSNSGRFIGQDPTGFGAGDSNLYRYVGNNPVGATDPSGNVKIELVFNPLIGNNNTTYVAGGGKGGLLPGQRRQNITVHNSIDHAFIRITDDCPGGGNKQYYYRGGPLNDFGSDAAIKKGLGPLVASTGSYFYINDKNKSTDGQDPKIQVAMTVLNKKGEPMTKYDRRLKNSINLTNQSNKRYELYGPNSNSFAYQALKDLGISANLPSGINAPGWGMNPRDAKYRGWSPLVPPVGPHDNLPENLPPGTWAM